MNEYTVFELMDPREPDLPVWVGWGSGTPWSRPELAEPRLREWFAELRERGCEPVTRPILTGLTMAEADQFARFRIKQIVEFAGGDAAWLLNENRPPRSGKNRRVVFGENKWPSIAAAALATSHRRETIRRYCEGRIGGWRFCGS
jgi:hypothetical protein